MLEKASSEMDTVWMQMLINDPDTVDPFMLSLKNNNDLPTKINVLVLFYFFWNIEKSKQSLTLLTGISKNLLSTGSTATFPSRLTGGSGRGF